MANRGDLLEIGARRESGEPVERDKALRSRAPKLTPG